MDFFRLIRKVNRMEIYLLSKCGNPAFGTMKTITIFNIINNDCRLTIPIIHGNKTMKPEHTFKTKFNEKLVKIL